MNEEPFPIQQWNQSVVLSCLHAMQNKKYHKNMCMLILPVHCQVHVQSEHGPCVHQEYIQHVEAAAAAFGRSSDTNSSLQLSLYL